MTARRQSDAVAPVGKVICRLRKLNGWILAGLVLLLSGSVWLWLERGRGLRLPQISTETLDANAAATLQVYLETLRAAPRSGPAWGRLGGMLRSFEFRDEARRCLERAQQLDPREARWPHLLGLLLLEISSEQAAAKFRRAADLCGVRPDAPRLRLAKLLAEAGDWTELERVLEPLVQAEPGHGPALLLLGQAALVRGDLARASALATRSAQDQRTGRGGWSLLAAVYQRQGLPEPAREAGQRAAALPPDAALQDPFEIEVAVARADPRQLSNRAQQLLMSRRLAEAGPIIQQLVKEHPRFAEGWLLLGRQLLLHNQLAEAESAVRRHLEIEPNSVQGLFQMGMVQMKQERLAEAGASFQQATRLKPDFGPAFFNLGFVLVRSERKPEAVVAFREAIRHNPEYADSYLLLADLLLQLGQKAEAASVARQGETIHPGDRRWQALKEKLQDPSP